MASTATIALRTFVFYAQTVIRSCQLMLEAIKAEWGNHLAVFPLKEKTEKGITLCL